MALKTILNKQTDFTGEFPEEWAKGGLWRFNESDPDEDDCLLDSSGMGRAAYINNWSGTSASLSANRMGNYIRMNIVNPSSEQNYLKVTNDGSIFAEPWRAYPLWRLDVADYLFRGEHLLPDLQYPVRAGAADFLPVPHPWQAEDYALQRYRFFDSGRVCRAAFFPGQRRLVLYRLPYRAK